MTSNYNFYACYVIDSAQRRRRSLFDPELANILIRDIINAQQHYRMVDLARKERMMIRAIGNHMVCFRSVMSQLDRYHDSRRNNGNATMVNCNEPPLLRRQNAISWMAFPPYRYHPNSERFFEIYDWEQ